MATYYVMQMAKCMISCLDLAICLGLLFANASHEVNIVIKQLQIQCLMLECFHHVRSSNELSDMTYLLG